MGTLDNITAGNPRILIKPPLYTTMADVAGSGNSGTKMQYLLSSEYADTP